MLHKECEDLSTELKNVMSPEDFKTVSDIVNKAYDAEFIRSRNEKKTKWKTMEKKNRQIISVHLFICLFVYSFIHLFTFPRIFHTKTKAKQNRQKSPQEKEAKLLGRNCSQLSLLFARRPLHMSPWLTVGVSNNNKYRYD